LRRPFTSSHHAASAGTEPARQVQRNVLDAMRGIDLELSAERPKMLTNDMELRVERVITMGCAADSKACPRVALEEVIDWGLPDPSNRNLGVVQTSRDNVRRRAE